MVTLSKPNKTLKVQLVGGYYILPRLDLSNKVISIEEWCKSRPLSIQEYCELNHE
jgi:hypothetical protein